MMAMLKKIAFAFLTALVLVNASAALTQPASAGPLVPLQVRPLVPLAVPPPPTPQFNNPSPQITLSRPGNPVNPQGLANQQGLAAHLRAEALGGVSGGISEPSGGYGGICRGC
jgi:hypothetical protein